MQGQRGIELAEHVVGQRGPAGRAAVVLEEGVDGADADHRIHVGDHRHQNQGRQAHDAPRGGAGGGGQIDDHAVGPTRKL